MAVPLNSAPIVKSNAVKMTVMEKPPENLGPETVAGSTSRRMRVSKSPPSAASANRGVATRSSSSDASARAYATRSAQTTAARSSQQFSRSIRTCFDTHHTAG
jgi:hypothetical protein